MALQSVIGWILFLIFGGWGLLSGPADWVHEFFRRPKTVITKSQYLERARGIAQRAREIKATGDMLKRQDRASGGTKSRGWRTGVRRLQREVVSLEEDERALDASFPRGADGEARWVLLQLSYLAVLLGGVAGVGLSLMWIAHVVVYMLPPVPLHPLLNAMFARMDGVFPLFGVAFFSLFTFYLLGETELFSRVKRDGVVERREREGGGGAWGWCCFPLTKKKPTTEKKNRKQQPSQSRATFCWASASPSSRSTPFAKGPP
jgi:LMBR1 domain-containing protein 1